MYLPVIPVHRRAFRENVIGHGGRIGVVVMFLEINITSNYVEVYPVSILQVIVIVAVDTMRYVDH